MVDMSEIEEDIQSRFMKSLHEFRNKGGVHREGIHVSDLVSDCLRSVYYNKTVGERLMDLDGYLRTGYGMMVHEMIPLSEENELKVEYETSNVVKIVGRIDDVIMIDGKLIILDKKTTRKDIKYAYNNHWRQLYYYSVLYKETYDKDVDYVALCYINLEEVGLPKVFVNKVGDLYSVKAEMVSRAEAISNYLESNVLPPKKYSRSCKWCDYVVQCSGDSDFGD